MKKTWIALCLVVLALPLCACSGKQTGSGMATPSAVPSALPRRSPGRDDLAGADGMVGGTDGAETPAVRSGRIDPSPYSSDDTTGAGHYGAAAGDGGASEKQRIENTLDGMENWARNTDAAAHTALY